MSDPTLDQPPEPEPAPPPEPEEPPVVTGLPPAEDVNPAFVTVTALDPDVANPGPSPHDVVGPAEIKVVTHDGQSFFHTLLSLPARFKDDAGNVIFGHHAGVTAEEAS